MKHLLSIFSFDTLQVRWRLPRALLLFLLLLIGSEAGFRVLNKWSGLKSLQSIDAKILDRVAEIQTRQPNLWIMGNSTERAIAADAIAEFQNQSMIRLVHGSATLRATSHLLDYYLKHGEHRPQSIIVMFSVDDLNRNGQRASRSAHYDRYQNLLRAPWIPRLFLVQEAHVIGDVLECSLWKDCSRERVPWEQKKQLVFRPGERKTWKRQIGHLSKNFAPDWETLNLLATTVKRFELPDVTVALLPVTDYYIDHHKGFADQKSYAAFRETLGRRMKARGLPFVDLGASVQDYSYFRDPYHANSRGQEHFTALMIRQLKSQRS